MRNSDVDNRLKASRNTTGISILSPLPLCFVLVKLLILFVHNVYEQRGTVKLLSRGWDVLDNHIYRETLKDFKSEEEDKMKTSHFSDILTVILH
jgi:hypothetical protein